MEQKSEHKHWSEHLADLVITEKKEPYIITSGMTTSGPAHFGTVCEFLFPFTIGEMLKRKGKKIEFYLFADIMDAFDNVPLPMEKYKTELEPHLGKPLTSVPDPTGKSTSFGDYYLDEVRELMKKLGVTTTVLRANEVYSDGKFDEWARFFLKHEEKTREIVERTSGRILPKDFSPIMPICQTCGKIATTRVTKHDTEQYTYVCDKDVKYTKGCGQSGSGKISDHQYKIVWRLHWPAEKQILKSAIEGAGVDHNTKGGSEDTCKAITLELMKKEYHIPYRYGFILLEGKKYSKSKGLGLGVTELLELIPPEILKYLLLKPDLEENIDINPTPENLLRAYDEFQQAALLAKGNIDTFNRSDRKKAIAFSLSTDTMHWSALFLDIILYYQVYYDWKKVGEVLDDSKGVTYLKPYAEQWIKRNFLPDDYNFKYQPKKVDGLVKEFIESLVSSMDALAIHNQVFEFAKNKGVEPKDFFKQIYLALIGKERGPRIGKLIAALGVEKLKKDTR